MEIEYEHLLIDSLNRQINLFLGAGFSLLARDIRDRPLPLANQLAAELRERYSLTHLASMDLGRLCTIINATHPEDLRDYLVERFTVSAFDPGYSVIEDHLRISSIFTTNIDNLIFKIFESSPDSYINDLDVYGPVNTNNRAIDLIMLHGSVLNPSRPIRFGASEVAASFNQNQDRWYLFQSKLMSIPTLIWGCSISDAPLLEALLPSATRVGRSPDKWILVHPDLRDQGFVDYFHALNFHVIIGDTAALLAFIREKMQRKAPVVRVGDNSLIRMFPKNSIPLTTQVLNRPIVEFFRGAAPMWSDIYSGMIYKTSW